MRAISDVLSDFRQGLSGESITVGAILEALHERGFGFVLLIFAVPMALPIPVPPGVNVILALPLLILTGQQALGRHTIWMPARIKRRSIAREKLQGIIESALPWMKRLELVTRPRLGALTQGAFSNIIGVLGFIMALSITIPLPLTNTVPSFGIALMAVGVIMRDGLAVLAGAAAGTAWVAMLGFAALWFGVEGIDMIKQTIESFF